jgi:signal transduction histidine kinase/GAF domain-containing protein
MQQQFISCLEGRTQSCVSLSDDSFDESSSLASVAKANFGCGVAFFHILKLMLAYLGERFEEALAFANGAEPVLGAVMSMPIEATYHYYHALTLAALLPQVGESRRDSYRERLVKKARRLAEWAKHCPENFGSRSFLVQAELKRIDQQALEALRLYEQAQQLARQHGLIHEEALAGVRAAQYCAELGLDGAAQSHMRGAHYCYLRWGALGRARALEAQHPYLQQGTGLPQPEWSRSLSIEHLDLTTVVTTLQSLTSELELDKWTASLMQSVLENAGAERGVLLMPNGPVLQPLAVASTSENGINVRIGNLDESPPMLPSAVLRYVARTQEVVLLDEACAEGQFASDPYVAAHACRSVLCLPLVKLGKLAGALYLENNRAPAVFTPRRVSVLRLLVAQAAMSFESARLYTSVREENEARKRTEVALSRSEAYLAEAQRLSRTGSFGWNMGSGQLTFSAETHRLLELASGQTPHLDQVLSLIHPDDQAFVRGRLERAVREGGALDHEHRFLLPSGATKFVRVLGRPTTHIDGTTEYIGAITDITEQRTAEAALQHSQSELAQVMRVTALGELAASIAHEVNQPLAAIAGNCGAALNWLSATPPRTRAALHALAEVAADTERAGDILTRIRGFLAGTSLQHAVCDIEDVIDRVVGLIRSRFEHLQIALETQLLRQSISVTGDVVQLQQVLLNLLLNAADACKDCPDSRRRVQVRTAIEETATGTFAVVSVVDQGVGLGEANSTRIFDAFYTTKPDGLGMGLSISRSIAKRFGGTLVVTPNPLQGVTFSLSLPVAG